jgi:hypothetical protein
MDRLSASIIERCGGLRAFGKGGSFEGRLAEGKASREARKKSASQS